MVEGKIHRMLTIQVRMHQFDASLGKIPHPSGQSVGPGQEDFPVEKVTFHVYLPNGQRFR